MGIINLIKGKSTSLLNIDYALRCNAEFDSFDNLKQAYHALVDGKGAITQVRAELDPNMYRTSKITINMGVPFQKEEKGLKYIPMQSEIELKCKYTTTGDTIMTITENLQSGQDIMAVMD